MNVSFLQELLVSVAEQGRQLLPRSLGGSLRKDDVHELAAALLSGRGEASGVAIASEILARYQVLQAEERHAFLGFLATMQPDTDALPRTYLPRAESAGHPESARPQLEQPSRQTGTRT